MLVSKMFILARVVYLGVLNPLPIYSGIKLIRKFSEPKFAIEQRKILSLSASF